MFKTYCGDCGNSWYIGNPRTCTCPWKDALKREWVGLTDEETEWCDTHSHGNTEWMKKKAFARAIEAKLRSKNEDRN
jgi:hypothetical protein